MSTSTSAAGPVLEAFQEVLGSDVRPDSDFFDHGGTSLQAMHIIHKITTATGVSVSPTDLFDASTPAAIAELVSDRSTSPDRHSDR